MKQAEAGYELRIGTRSSPLAVWQANFAKKELAGHGIGARIVPIESEGDMDLTTPLYKMGIQGVFTRTLDAALLEGKIDIAVHSMKDVPTSLAQGLSVAAVLPRGKSGDVLLVKDPELFSEQGETKKALTIATSSIRRKAQWLHRYPYHTMVDLRGNIQTRLQKLRENPWDGAIFAEAALDRLEYTSGNRIALEWMLPAPSQGAVCLVCRTEDEKMMKLCRLVNHQPSCICTYIEREFLRYMQGGCSTPIAAHAEIIGGMILFKGRVNSTDGSYSKDIERSAPLVTYQEIGKVAALSLLNSDAGPVVEQFIKNRLDD